MVPLRRRFDLPSSASAPRLAWLRPEFATLYPELPAGTWVTARSATLVIAGGVFGGERGWPAPGSRVLPDQHFLFRSGGRRQRGWTGPLTRMDDP
jgi:hypothetical protein